MRKLIVFVFLFTSAVVYSQIDSSLYARLDSMSAEELGQYYANEPLPPQHYKGPDTGDSLYRAILPLSEPTQTLEGQPLSFRKHQQPEKEEAEEQDTSATDDTQFRPKISLGGGSLSFHGDIGKKKFQSLTVGRPAADLGISQRLTRYLQLDFTALFGRLGADEFQNHRQDNFISEIRAGGVNLLYDFGNLFDDKLRVRPYVSFGIMGFEFLSKTDLKDKFGNTYHYWSDGSIRNMAESSPGAQNSIMLVRDYKYESDIRELNKDGFGKYRERAWSFPIGTGFEMKVTPRVDLRLNFQYFISTTDYIDGINENSLNGRTGNKRNDNFMYTSVSLQYDLIVKPPRKKSPADTISDKFWLASDAQDHDNDGVPNGKDNCPGTPDGVKVDEKGCPLDEDGDGIPNYRDDELNSAPGAIVNGRGVTVADEHWKKWYDAFMNDTTDLERSTQVMENVFAAKPKGKKKKPKENNDVFTVELARYKGAIPSDELAFLLSIGDINSSTLPDGTTVVYTTGNYDKLSNAVKRRDEFREEGIKEATISRVKGNQIIPVTDDELKDLLKSELEDLMKINVDSSGTGDPERERFGKDDIVYRVQLGAYRNRISTKVFNTSAGSVLELKTGESIYRYVTKGYKTIEEAAGVRADLVIQGYGDAFITAYKGGKRVPLSETKATVETNFKEDLSENKMFSSVDKSLVIFKVQLGQLKKKAFEASTDEKYKDLPDLEKQITLTGSIRYMAGGNFSSLQAADKFKEELINMGFFDAFTIATFKGEVISTQEALELLK